MALLISYARNIKPPKALNTTPPRRYLVPWPPPPVSRHRQNHRRPRPRRAGAGNATNGTGTAAAGCLPSFASQTRCLRLPEVPPVPPALPVPPASLLPAASLPPTPACAAARTGWRCKPSCTAANRHGCWLAVFADRSIAARGL